jgi:hypothetical protein
MDEELGAAPGSLEAPPTAPPVPRSQAAGAEKQEGKTGTSHEQVNYTSAAERCETCEYFDEDAFHCKKNNFDCEPQGHCDKFEVLGAAAGAGGEGELPEEPEEEAEELGAEELDNEEY